MLKVHICKLQKYLLEESFKACKLFRTLLLTIFFAHHNSHNFGLIILVRYDDSLAVPCKQLCQRWSTSGDNDLDQFAPSDLTSLTSVQVVEFLALLVEQVRMLIKTSCTFDQGPEILFFVQNMFKLKDVNEEVIHYQSR